MPIIPITISGQLNISGRVNVSGVLNVMVADNPSGGGAPWTPAQLGAAVRSWYQFDLLTGSNGDPQGSVTDSSGNGFTLTQTGSARPTLAAADLNALNTLYFDDAFGQGYPLDDAVLAGLSAGSFYIVYKGTVSTTNALFSAGGGTFDSHYPYFDNHFYNDFGSSVRYDAGVATNSVTSYRSLSIYGASNDWAFYVDGGTGGSSGGTSPLNHQGTNTVAWRTGANIGRGGGGNTSSGWIAEVLLTNAKQSDANRQKVEGYLAWKWGIQGNLDTTHPYKAAAPTV